MGPRYGTSMYKHFCKILHLFPARNESCNLVIWCLKYLLIATSRTSEDRQEFQKGLMQLLRGAAGIPVLLCDDGQIVWNWNETALKKWLGQQWLWSCLRVEMLYTVYKEGTVNVQSIATLAEWHFHVSSTTFFFCFLQDFRFHRVHREIALQVPRCWKHLNSGNHCCGNWSMRMVLAPVASGSMLPSGQPWLENHQWLRDFTAMITRGSCVSNVCFQNYLSNEITQKRHAGPDMCSILTIVWQGSGFVSPAELNMAGAQLRMQRRLFKINTCACRLYIYICDVYIYTYIYNI